jgi:hypothetical protein
MFKVGDQVTRDGSDIQEVIAVGGYDDITVRCIKAPEAKWCKVGEIERNLAGRYIAVQ